MTENEKYLFDHFLISIKSGFDSFEDVIDSTLESLEDEGWESEITEEWVNENVSREYNKHIEESRKWQHPTDTEKLHAVFDNLCKKKIVALHNAGYTLSEAVYDCQEVWGNLTDVGIKPIGYCYYHGQDLERVINDGTLHIGFDGEKPKNDKEAIAIANIVVAELKSAGFNVNWNGSASKRIEITGFNWQNTFTSDEDVEEKWGYERVSELMAE